MWSVDGGNGLTASWVNTDGSTATLSVLYYATDNNFVFTANPTDFVDTFGSGDATVRIPIRLSNAEVDIICFRLSRLWLHE